MTRSLMNTLNTRTSRVIFAAAGMALASSAFGAASLADQDIDVKVDGTSTEIGEFDASLNGNRMDVTFTLSAAHADLTNWVNFHWLQLVTGLTAAESNPDWNGANLVIPVIDTPSGGYDGQVGEDDIPWYLTAAEETALNGMGSDGSKTFHTNDTPSVMGAKFETWLVFESGETDANGNRLFCVVEGFEWGSGDMGGDATLKSLGVAEAADVTRIGTALGNSGFGHVAAGGDIGWIAQRDCNIVCIPTPGSAGLLAISSLIACRRRRRA